MTEPKPIPWYFILILMMISYILIEFKLVDIQKERWDQTKEFMSRGGRNTAHMGYDLCKRVVALEKRLEIQTDAKTCKDIYYYDNHK